MDAKAKPTDFLFFNYSLSAHMSHLVEEKHKPKGLKKKKRGEKYIIHLIIVWHPFVWYRLFQIVGYVPAS